MLARGVPRDRAALRPHGQPGPRRMVTWGTRNPSFMSLRPDFLRRRVRKSPALPPSRGPRPWRPGMSIRTSRLSAAGGSILLVAALAVGITSPGGAMPDQERDDRSNGPDSQSGVKDDFPATPASPNRETSPDPEKEDQEKQEGSARSATVGRARRTCPGRRSTPRPLARRRPRSRPPRQWATRCLLAPRRAC